MAIGIDTGNPEAVRRAVETDYRLMTESRDPEFVSRAFEWALMCFQGRYRDYGPIDAKYHDLEHTLQVTLCMSRLLKGRFLSGAAPAMDARHVQLGLLAILLHDTGYLKTRDDREGTGAKYTLIHVNRSAEFAAVLLAEKGYGPEDVSAVKNMIRCTGVNADLAAIPFDSERERIMGFCLGAADLLGQMAADNYLEKLPALFEEFDECARRSGDAMPDGSRFESVEDLTRRTPLFWRRYALPKINGDFLGVHRCLERLPPDENFYLQAIEAHIGALEARFGVS